MDDGFEFERERLFSGSAHQRIATRDSMFLQARTIREGKPDVPLRVRNLSSGGLMGETDQIFVTGERVSVELRTIGTVTGRVAWATPTRIGVAFDQQIDPKLARKAPPQSPGSSVMLIPPVTISKRPAVRDK